MLADAREHHVRGEDEVLRVAERRTASTSSQVIGVETVGRGIARSE